METSVAVAEKPKKDPSNRPTRTPAVSIRATAEWKAWLEKLADFDRGSVADVIDRALARYATEIRFPDSPPKR
jgi:hypothetical protein